MGPLHRINQIVLVTCIVVTAAFAGSATQAFGAASTTATAPTAIASVLPTASAMPTVVPIAYYSGTRGHPYNMPAIDLASYGYAESEFQISGAGNLYAQAQRFLSDGVWNVKVKRANYPYTSRILVRQPTDLSKFNGTVVVEWLNVSTDSDTDSEWAFAYEEFMRRGYAWVGVSAQKGGIANLVQWDPVRYGALSQGNDGVSYDIFTQVAQLVRNNPGMIFTNLVPLRLIAAGNSQSALRLTTYVNAFQPLSHAFDGFMIHGRSYTSAPLGDGQYSHVVTLIRSDNATPVFQLVSQYEIEGYFKRARQPDTDYLRTWEVAGATHIDRYSGAYQSPIALRDNGHLPLSCTKPSNRCPYYYAAQAAWYWLNRWAIDATQPPHGDVVQVNSRSKIVRDAHGNALGGVRLPDLDAPTQTFTTKDNEGAPGGTERDFALCPFVGTSIPFDSAKLQSLYSSHQGYVNKVEAAATEALQNGFILQEGYNDAISRAEAASIP